MKRIAMALLALSLLLLIFCDDSVTVNVDNEASISGRILPAGILPSITMTQGATTVSTTCDASGNFSLSGLLSGSAIMTITAANYGTNTRFISLSGGGHNQLSDITLSKLPNPVSSLSPADNDNNVSLSSNITIYFFREMDSASTESAFLISPSIEGKFEWGSDFKRLSFDPTNTLASGTSYTITLDTSALEVDSTVIEFPLSYSFSTAGFSLGSISPQTGSSGISLTTILTVSFSSQYDNTKLLDYITVTPAIELEINQVSGNYTYIKPTNGYWAANTQYVITISDSFTNIFGTFLDNEYSASFTTANGEVTSVTPADSSDDVSISQNISISFNTKVNKANIEQALMIVDSSGDTLDGNFLWSNNNSLSFYPEDELKTSGLYFITMDTTATDFYGKKINSFESQFSTETFEIESISPEDKSTGISVYTSLSLRFNASIDKNTFSNRVHVSPPTTLEFSYSGNYVYVKPTGSYWQPGTKYTFTIEDSLTDINGEFLGDSVVTSFTTTGIVGSADTISITPKDSSTGISLSSAIYVNYGVAVDRNIAEGAFIFRDYNDSILSGKYSWNSNSTQLTFTPFKLLHPSKKYKATSSSLKSIEGDTLKAAISTFTTTPLWVSYTNPSNGSANNTLAYGCSFQFNSYYNTAGIEDYFTITPAIDLKFSLSSNTVNVFPRDYNNWASNTKYTITIDSSLADVWGGVMGRDYVYEFTTIPLLITQTIPTDEAVDVGVTGLTYSIYFNTEIDSLSATTAVSLKEKVSGNIVAGTVGVLSPPTIVTFTPTAALTNNLEYEIVVDTTITDLYSIKSKEIKNFTFTTIP